MSWVAVYKSPNPSSKTADTFTGRFQRLPSPDPALIRNVYT
jgi:hypothetical protein